MFHAPSPVIVMVSSPSRPYDVGEMRSESRPHALNASRVSTSSPRRGEHFVRAFQTLVSHEDHVRTVARNRNGVVAIISLRRRGDEIESRPHALNTSPSINFLSAAGRALPPLPFQTLISHEDLVRTVALNRDGVIAFISL